MLDGLFGRPVALQGGGTVVADESYIRESIVNPQAKIVAGDQPLMPTFQGLISEEGLLQLVAYVKALGAKPPPAAQGQGGGAGAVSGPETKAPGSEFRK